MGYYPDAHAARTIRNHAPVALAVQVLDRFAHAIDLFRSDIGPTVDDPIHRRDADAGKMRDLLDRGFPFDRHAFQPLDALRTRPIEPSPRERAAVLYGRKPNFLACAANADTSNHIKYQKHVDAFEAGGYSKLERLRNDGAPRTTAASHYVDSLWRLTCNV